MFLFNFWSVLDVLIPCSRSAKSNSAVNKGIYPSADIAFKALLSARFCAAMWSNISDCDETFNYWEPVGLSLCTL